MMKELHSRIAVITTAVLIVCAFLAQKFAGGSESTWHGSHIRCAIELGRYDDTTRGLITGYNYHLLEKFAEDNGATIKIIHSYRNEASFMDSLKNGVVDLVAIPYADSVAVDSVLVSNPIDSMSIWVLGMGERKRMAELNRWIENYHGSEVFQPTRERFLRTYDPIKRAKTGRTYTYISPYDSLIKKYAEPLGWDWRMLAAVIYQESHFRIGVRSRRGAAGIMQMMPHTAGRMNAEDLFNPEEGIRAGAAYLKKLSNRYAKTAANMEERQKFTLAAYNAGEGRIQDCLNLAAKEGKDTGRWDEIVSIIPKMNDESILQEDTVKLGTFKGKETIAYVNRILELYDAFRKICP